MFIFMLDDTVFYSSATTNNQAISPLAGFKLVLNTEKKTKFRIFSTKNTIGPNATVSSLTGSQIEQVFSVTNISVSGRIMISLFKTMWPS